MKWLPVVCLMSMLVTACSVRAGQATPPVIPATAQSSEAITRTPDLGNQIRSMKVQLVARDTHPTVQLADGTYRSTNDTASPDYADVTLLAEPTALGDLNGDGIADAAALLAENYGGTGTFVSLLAYPGRRRAAGASRRVPDRRSAKDRQRADR